MNTFEENMHYKSLLQRNFIQHFLKTPQIKKNISIPFFQNASTHHHDAACTAQQYKCNGSRCLNSVFLCDGVEDCPNGDDESHPTCGEGGDHEWNDVCAV